MQQGRKKEKKTEGDEKVGKVVEVRRKGKEKWKAWKEKMNEKINGEEKKIDLSFEKKESMPKGRKSNGEEGN